MRFCPEDGSVMTLDTSTGEPRFNCACGRRFPDPERGEKPDPNDARIASGALREDETLEKFTRTIRDAPFDPANQKVAADCPDCGRDYLTQVILGPSQIVIRRCRCGWQSK